jgi:hypothetical protein
MYNDVDYEAIRRRVIEKTQRRYRFIVHTVIFVLGFPLVGGISPLVFVLWIAAWAFHFLWLSYHHTLEQSIETEVEAERERIAKAKRDGTFVPLGLGDDGEFVPYYEDEDQHEQYRQ